MGDFEWDAEIWPCDIAADRAARRSENRTVRRSINVQVAEQVRAQSVDVEVARRLAIVDSFGADIYPAGTVVKFEKRFSSTPDARAYSYAAIKVANGQWYLTGTTGSRTGMTWDEFVLYFASGEVPVTPDDVWVASEWVKRDGQ